MTTSIPDHGRRAAAVASVALLAACSDSDAVAGPGPSPELDCSIPTSQVFNGQVKDGIPALTNPRTNGVGGQGTEYLRDDDRVIGLVSDGRVLAIPLNILWWHEIVNLDFDGRQLAVTHCPLTGSSLAFDRAGAGGAEFGVSGLLFRNNLMMYDRTTDQSLWPQMARGARCGARDGVDLTMYPVVETTWSGWSTLYPDTEVVTSRTGFDNRNYQAYPYGDYDRVDNPQLLYPQGTLDPRRPPKERVLGIPDGNGGGIAFPFGALAAVGFRAVQEHAGRVVFWDGDREAAMAYVPAIDGQALTFAVRERAIVDAETGSTWTVAGLAVDGPLTGRRLTPVAEAYVSFWFAWAAFQPDTDLWSVS